MPEDKKDNFLKSLKRNITILDLITLVIVFAIFFVTIILIFKLFHYIPSVAVVIILFIVALLAALSLYVAKIGSLSAIQVITKRKHADKANQKQIKRLSVLNSVEKAVNSSLDLQVTLDVLVSQVTSQLNIDAASILLLNKQTKTLKYVISKGFRSSALKYTQLKLGESNAGRAATERRTITIQNLREESGGFEHSPLFNKEDFVTYFAVPLVAKGEVKGVLELFHRSPMESDYEWLKFLETIANQASIAIDNSTLFDELIHAYDSTIVGWSRALELRDKETEGHTQRVAETTIHLAREMGIADEEIVHIKRGALLHDMGKLGIPDSILLKPASLTEKEWAIMKQHPKYAYNMLYPIEYLRPAIEIPYCHHEKWDGTGYPTGLKGDKIPLAARVFAVVDVWDALCSDRPYRSGWPKDKVHGHILSLRGTHFDPEVVKVFSKMGL
jgi:HD-GYP domain-containing protein (c-di-GMP phosphodiesterase class II)